MKTETAILQEVVRLLKGVKDHFVYKFHGTTFSTAGVPDVLFICPSPIPEPGHHSFVAFIEVKRPGAKQTPLQEHVAGKIRRAGTRVYTVHSKEEAAELLKQNGIHFQEKPQ